MRNDNRLLEEAYNKVLYNEGLENHVDRVLNKAGYSTYAWHWDDGLTVLDPKDAEAIVDILNRSNEFGQAGYNPETKKIEFAPYPPGRGVLTTGGGVHISQGASFSPHVRPYTG